MSRCRPWRRASAWLAPLLVLATAAHAGPVEATGGDGARRQAQERAATGPRETLVLAVTLDGEPRGEPVVAHRIGRDVSVRAADLRRIGIAVPPAATGEVDLASIAGLRFAVDDGRQTLDLESISTHPASLSLGRSPSLAAEDGPPARAWGGFVNYDATAYRDASGNGLGGTIDAVVFTPGGYGFAGVLWRKPTTGPAIAIRTDIGYTADSRDRLASLTVGDYVNAASSFSRPVRMAGFRIGTDFSLRPDLVTFPVPTVAGTAAVPTAVDVLVNGDRQPAGDVRAGRFAVTDIPVRTGINTIAVATRDALGRDVFQTVTTYASRALLRPGLVAFSGEAGWVRTGYLTSDDRYRAFAGSGTVRRGLTGRLTLEAHGEATRAMGDLGIGASVGLGRLGLVDAAVAVSRDATMRRTGTQLSLGLERIARPVSLSVRYVRNAAGWSDLAGRYGSVTRDHSLILNIGFDLGRVGTLAASAIDLGRGTARFDPRGGYLRDTLAFTGATTLVNATYTARLVHKLGIVATVGMDARRRGSLFASVGALMLFGSRTSAYAGVQHQSGRGGASASFTRTPIEQGQWGYRVTASGGVVDRAGAAVRYLGRSGAVEAAVDSVGGRIAAQVSARGSIGVAGGHAFASDTMTTSFAVIETHGQGNLAIYQDNRRIGTTNAGGVLVAPNLPAYQRIKFSIDPVDVHAAAQIEQAETFVSLPRRSGAAVSFDLRPSRARSIRLVDGRGDPLAAGARATIGGRAYPVGIGGVMYAELPVAGEGFAVRLGDGSTCRARVPAALPASFTPVTVVCAARSAPGRAARTAAAAGGDQSSVDNHLSASAPSLK